MKQHKGMRPQDIVILLKIIAKKEKKWYMKDLAIELSISQSEVSESLSRSAVAGLVTQEKKDVNRYALAEFLLHGFRYVFPVKPQGLERGIVTGHSVPPISDFVKSSEIYVWPWAEGDSFGFAVEPLHPGVPKACKDDPVLHELLALADTIRTGNNREVELAKNELKKRIQEI